MASKIVLSSKYYSSGLKKAETLLDQGFKASHKTALVTFGYSPLLVVLVLQRDRRTHFCSLSHHQNLVAFRTSLIYGPSLDHMALKTASNHSKDSSQYIKHPALPP